LDEVGEKNMESNPTYAQPSIRRFNVLAVISLGIAMISLALPCLIALMLFKNRGNAVSPTSIGVNPAFYAMPLAGIVCAVIAGRKRSKLLPAVSIVLSLIACLSMWYITSRSW
jgi:hypothetical protein